jgi:hypothetical protein
MAYVIEKDIQLDPREYVLSVSFMKVGKQYFFDFTGYPQIEVGDFVIADSRHLGQQMGEVKAFKAREEVQAGDEVHQIARPATPADLLQNQQWKEQEVPRKSSRSGRFRGHQIRGGRIQL